MEKYILEKVTPGPKYTLNKILDHTRDEEGTLYFNIRWTNYDKPTWEHRKYVPEEIMSRYFSSLEGEFWKKHFFGRPV